MGGGAGGPGGSLVSVGVGGDVGRGGKGVVGGKIRWKSMQQFSTRKRTDEFSGVCERLLRKYIPLLSLGERSGAKVQNMRRF